MHGAKQANRAGVTEKENAWDGGWSQTTIEIGSLLRKNPENASTEKKQPECYKQ